MVFVCFGYNTSIISIFIYSMVDALSLDKKRSGTEGHKIHNLSTEVVQRSPMKHINIDM